MFKNQAISVKIQIFCLFWNIRKSGNVGQPSAGAGHWLPSLGGVGAPMPTRCSPGTAQRLCSCPGNPPPLRNVPGSLWAFGSKVSRVKGNSAQSLLLCELLLRRLMWTVADGLQVTGSLGAVGGVLWLVVGVRSKNTMEKMPRSLPHVPGRLSLTHWQCSWGLLNPERTSA